MIVDEEKGSQSAAMAVECGGGTVSDQTPREQPVAGDDKPRMVVGGRTASSFSLGEQNGGHRLSIIVDPEQQDIIDAGFSLWFERDPMPAKKNKLTTAMGDRRIGPSDNWKRPFWAFKVEVLGCPFSWRKDRGAMPVMGTAKQRLVKPVPWLMAMLDMGTSNKSKIGERAGRGHILDAFPSALVPCTIYVIENTCRMGSGGAERRKGERTGESVVGIFHLAKASHACLVLAEEMGKGSGANCRWGIHEVVTTDVRLNLPPPSGRRERMGGGSKKDMDSAGSNQA
ncbi:hypothetical protein BDK51DRAFT_28124 [Blyttiomyces helicus]|uniref:Uncharacterized protein n=1 Tax=Blyttiomyces helicus TaxID=388810 RepID=A0A4P9W3W9_9FUNG|nr:hypothetical protein BDK51DRAFT_28124 [Blyttiomyces helicus]|eukprot:RKO87031.1 hypothetical protein BDK51DRAFT_28124 [Blyttiomyces helicus]